MEPFLGEIRLMGFAFDTAEGWLLCDGRILQIRQYSALFSLLSNRFGGDGTTTFAIPDLRGRVGVHFNGTYQLGTNGGKETVTLTSNEVPPHTHTLNGTSENADKPGVGTSAARLLGVSTATLYGAAANMVAMNDATSGSGSSQSHDNMQPSQVVAYCIASVGLYPPRS